MSLLNIGPKPSGPTHPPKVPPPPPPPPPPPTFSDFLALWRACVVLTCRLAWDVATDIRTAHRERAQFQGRRVS